MKKALKYTTIAPLILIFVNFITYQTSQMKKPVSFNFIEILFGKEIILNGVKYTSGFSIFVLIAVVFVILAVMAAWTIKNIKKVKLYVLVFSVISLVSLTITMLGFSKNSSFASQFDTLLPGGIAFKPNIVFSLLITALLFNTILGLCTENFTRNIAKYKWFYIMLAPTLLFLVIFVYLPMLGLALVFLDYNIADITQSTWAGLKWFKIIFNNIDGEFGQILWNTLVISVCKMIIGFPAPIILALMFNECNHMMYKKIVQSVTYLPHFISWAILSGLMISLFSSEHSLLNGILSLLGKEEFYLFQEVGYVRTTMIFSSLWKNIGWSAIIYMAAFSGISPELYESAKLDGAGKFAQIWYITIPGISAIIVMNLILSSAGLMAVDFEQALNIVTPMTVEKGKVLSQYVYDIGIRGKGIYGLGGNYSYSTALGLFQSLLSLGLVIGTNKLAKRINEDGAIW